jgi:hypothetical protein
VAISQHGTSVLFTSHPQDGLVVNFYIPHNLINDIADDMLGLGRLFADDTSIGHTAHDETTLKNMINIDLKYIQEWSKRWLVTFNPSKTDIMVFSANNQQNDLAFDFNSTLIQTVNTHKHLGVIFSCDCKWTKH